MLDPEKAEWLADLITQATRDVAESPCLIIEVEGCPQQWVQVLPQMNDDANFFGYLINLPFRKLDKNPLSHLRQVEIPFPDNTTVVDYEELAFATLWVGVDQQPLDIAHLVGETLERALGSQANPELSIRIEFGY